jgi:hypothetical protein
LSFAFGVDWFLAVKAKPKELPQPTLRQTQGPQKGTPKI